MFSPYDTQEDLSASELLTILISTDYINVNGESYDLSEITDMIDIELMREAIQNQLEAPNSVRKLYVNQIAEMLG